MVEYALPIPKIEDIGHTIDLNLSSEENLKRIETTKYLNSLRSSDKPYVKLKAGKELDYYLKSKPTTLDLFIEITKKSIPEDKQIKEEFNDDLVWLIEHGMVAMSLKDGEKGNLREVLEEDSKKSTEIYKEFKKTLKYLETLKSETKS